MGLYLRCLFFAVCIAIVGATGGLAQARSLAEIKNTKELRVCLVPDPIAFTIEPADCIDNCKFGGDAYDLSRAFVASPLREKKLSFVTVYPTRMMVVTNRANRAELKSSKDLCGKTAASIKDTTYQIWLQGQNEGACADNPIRIRLMTFEEASTAVDTEKVDFLVQNFEETIWLASPFKNSVAVFAVGPMYQQGWAFRKEDKDLQAAAQAFFEAQKAATDSLLSRQWKKSVGMSLPEYIERIPK